MTNQDLLTEIRKIIIEETKYLRVYDAKIVELTQNAKVKCTIDSLNWNTPDKAVVCSMSDKNSLTAFKIGDIIKVGFTNGNPAQAYVVGLCNNYTGIAPTTYTTDNKTDVVYQDRENLLKILFDKKLNKITITGNVTIDILKANESFVKGDTLKVELQKDQTLMQVLQSSISGWIPAPNDGGAALKAALTAWFTLPQADYSNILSLTIKGE